MRRPTGRREWEKGASDSVCERTHREHSVRGLGEEGAGEGSTWLSVRGLGEEGAGEGSTLLCV